MTIDVTFNGVPVSDGDVVLLVLSPRPRPHVETPWFFIFKGPEFELTVACTDAAGNVATATATPEFRPPGHHGPPW